MKNVIVIGAGLAGLSAARQLKKTGFAVRVLEAQDQPGGRMGQRDSGPIAYNTGARLIYPFGRRLHALIDETGLRDALVPLRGLSAQCRFPDEKPDGKSTYRIDLMPSARTLATPGLGLCGRLGLMRSAAALLAWRGKTDPDMATSALAADHQTLAQYIRETAGQQVLERLIEPVFRGTRSQNPEDISPTFYLSTTPHLLGQDTVYTLHGGMGVLTRRLAQELDVQYGMRVVQIQTRGDANAPPNTAPCTVNVDGTAGSQALHADIVVCATEGAHAARLLHHPAPEQQRMLAAVRYNSLGILHVALKGDVPPMLEFASRHTQTRIQTRIATWQQTPARGHAPAMLYCQLTPEAVQEAIDNACTDDLQKLIWPEIQARLPDVNPRVVHTVNQWIPHKLPVFYPGYGQQVAQFLQWQQAQRNPQAAPRVYFCGDWLSQPLLNGACRSGFDVAQTIIGHWGG